MDLALAPSTPKTVQPSSMSCADVARPIPLPAPVTIAVRGVSAAGSVLSSLMSLAQRRREERFLFSVDELQVLENLGDGDRSRIGRLLEANAARTHASLVEPK